MKGAAKVRRRIKERKEGDEWSSKRKEKNGRKKVRRTKERK